MNPAAVAASRTTTSKSVKLRRGEVFGFMDKLPTHEQAIAMLADHNL